MTLTTSQILWLCKSTRNTLNEEEGMNISPGTIVRGMVGHRSDTCILDHYDLPGDWASFDPEDLRDEMQRILDALIADAS